MRRTIAALVHGGSYSSVPGSPPWGNWRRPTLAASAAASCSAVRLAWCRAASSPVRTQPVPATAVANASARIVPRRLVMAPSMPATASSAHPASGSTPPAQSPQPRLGSSGNRTPGRAVPIGIRRGCRHGRGPGHPGRPGRRGWWCPLSRPGRDRVGWEGESRPAVRTLRRAQDQEDGPLHPGELLVVPRGVRHCPVADEETRGCCWSRAAPSTPATPVGPAPRASR
jgi:hypothetical protein